MLKFPIVTAALVLLSLFNAKKLIVRENHDPGNCSKSNHGELILVKDRQNKDTILVCTEDDEVFSWKTTDNSKPPGEFFNPGYDCLDILNKNPKSKDGYYWVDFKAGKPKKVYCDMTTDGGGYILFGYINGTVTWGVPSNNETVQPFGDPHWSSEFGDVSVLDFRIQVASDNDMEKTKAHWAFRFKNKRLLKNLMIVDQGGCPSDFPGVGDVSYVKDLMRDEIVSKDFPCSIFGLYSHPLAKTGWTMMNLCLEKPCPNGFAFHPIFPFQLDFSGGFSYVVKKNISTPSGGSTAFFGCDKNKCCACYGPRGGRDVYCLKGCQATNGGTITKHASAWFWVRLNPPRKVWEKCMEYRSEDESGDSAWYKLEGERNIPVKGRCGRSEPLINDGVVVVEKLQDIPAVTGLLAFQKDSQTLNVRGNETWKPLAEEEKITHTLSEIYEQLTTMKKSVKKLENGTTKNSETLKIRHTVSEMYEQLTTNKERVEKLEHGTAKNLETLKMFTPNWKQCTWKAGDSRDNGLIRTCTFVKKRSDTYLRVFYEGTLRIYNCNYCCKRWYFTFGGAECDVAIEGVYYMWRGENHKDLHRHRHIEGYCGGILKGSVGVGFHVGNCNGYGNADAYSGWNSVSRIVIEEVLPSQ